MRYSGSSLPPLRACSRALIRSLASAVLLLTRIDSLPVSDSPLAQVTRGANQILLAVDHPEDYDRYSPMVSRLLHLMVIDILTTAVALRLPGELRPMLQEIKKTLRAKRYARAE